MNDKNDNEVRIGVYICHCGSNIAGTVDVEKSRDEMAGEPEVTIVRDYKFMCSEPGQELIVQDIKEKNLNRVVVASCSPLMHEPTFRKACEKAGLNKYLFQMVNIREQCSWVHKDIEAATKKAISLIRAAINRVAFQQPLETLKVDVHPDTLIVGAGIAGIQAALEIAESGNKVYLVEKESTIGGKMAKFDKTFPTLDCSACILTPKTVSVAQHENIELLGYSEVEEVEGSMGDFKMKNGKEPRAIGIIHCVGSRDVNYHAYCSRVCCMYALKFAHLITDKTNAEIYQFYIDMRAFGKGYEEIEVEPIQAVIDPELCAGCRICNNLCPYGSITFDEEKSICVVNEALCKGCGTCVASCPSSAASAKHFSDKQIIAEIEGMLQ